MSTPPFWDSPAGLRAALDGLDAMLLATDPEGIIRCCAAGAARGLGFAPEELVGRPLAELLWCADGTAAGDLVAKAHAGESDGTELAAARKDGSRFPVRLTLTAVGGNAETPGGFWCAIRDQTKANEYERELAECRGRLEELAATDALTGLKNRLVFQQRLDDEFRRAARYRTPLALVLIDVDQLKAFNEEFGHSVGDDVLRTVARVVKETGRTTDLPARYGGEEFAVLLTNTDPDGAAISAERFRRAVEAAAWPHRPVTVSVGVASYCHDMASSSVLVAAADKALARAKAGGRNRVEQ